MNTDEILTKDVVRLLLKSALLANRRNAFRAAETILLGVEAARRFTSLAQSIRAAGWTADGRLDDAADLLEQVVREHPPAWEAKALLANLLDANGDSRAPILAAEVRASTADDLVKEMLHVSRAPIAASPSHTLRPNALRRTIQG